MNVNMREFPAAGRASRGVVSRAIVAAVAIVFLACSPPTSAQSACDADLDGDGVVGAGDLAGLLGAWGPCVFGCAGDLSGDGTVDAGDLAALLGLWGSPCVSLPWATVLEVAPDPAVVTNSALYDAIIATGLPWRVRDNGTNIEMLLVPPGTFDMGCSPSSQFACKPEEKPVHSVTLTGAFYLGRYEVTQAEWTAKMGSNPSYFQPPLFANVPSRPVEKVSWSMVQGFVSSTGLRLPTEAEWEYACRAGTTTAFHSGLGFPNGTNNDLLVGYIAWYTDNSSGETHVVGGTSPNALGLRDMSGNVWEWVSDWYSSSYYASSPPVNPLGPATGTLRVIRGGAFNTLTYDVRSSTRGFSSPSSTNLSIGFRVAKTP